MANIRCPRCKEFYDKVSIKQVCCDTCQQKAQDDYTRVKEFVIQHGNMSVAELSKELNMDPTVILRYVQEGKLHTRKSF